MIDLQQKTEWQYLDEETGLLFPWYTKSCLDEIITWDLKYKKVFEFGLGASSLWWSRKCYQLNGTDSNEEYYNAVIEWFDENGYVGAGFMMCTDKKEEYMYAPNFNAPYDIIVIDGIYREECVPVALESLNPGGCIIYDNWMQPSVEVQSEETQRILLSLPHKIYSQEGHPDWQTLIVYP